MVAAAVAGAGLVGGIYSANQAGKAANKATNAQTAANQAAMAQQQANLEETRKLLAPYVQTGNQAIGQQGNLIGLGGNAAQQSAITALQNSPYFTSQLQAGQNAILQNASATGGLRGGNTQAALAQFAPSLLAQTIQNQFGNLGSLTSIGQASAAGVGNAGLANANNQSQLLQGIGSAQAGGAVAQGAANSGIANSLAGSLGLFNQLGGFGGMNRNYATPQGSQFAADQMGLGSGYSTGFDAGFGD
jgi:hypothetical protein